MELELKHLAPYLPYELNGISIEENLGIETVIGFNSYGKQKTICLITNIDDIDLPMFKPILRPLSQLTETIEHNGEKFVPIIRMVSECHFCGDYELNFMETSNSRSSRREYIVGYNKNMEINWNVLIFIDGMRYDYVQKLISWHFDVFNLIENNLAIAVTDELNPYK